MPVFFVRARYQYRGCVHKFSNGGCDSQCKLGRTTHFLTRTRVVANTIITSQVAAVQE